MLISSLDNMIKNRISTRVLFFFAIIIFLLAIYIDISAILVSLKDIDDDAKLLCLPQSHFLSFTTWMISYASTHLIQMIFLVILCVIYNTPDDTNLYKIIYYCNHTFLLVIYTWFIVGLSIFVVLAPQCRKEYPEIWITGLILLITSPLFNITQLVVVPYCKTIFYQ